jgi:hypothetical protein
MKINKEEKLKYLEEMIQHYTKQNQKKYFIEQFLNGAGNELVDKFWELRSSSRMAYDLYSWMKNDANVLDIEFEFQLPNLQSGGIGPNMDVFIETEDELIFIESKFTEKANLHYIDNGYLKEAYYIKSPYGRSQMGLEERFYDNKWAVRFSDFCTEWESLMTKKGWHKGKDWFEPKQETCHLSGILLFLFKPENAARIKNKKIRLYNIFWEMPQDGYSEMERQFCEKAQNLIEGIISDSKLDIIDFKINAFSVQDMLKTPNKLSKHIVFPDDYNKKFNNRNEDILKKEKIEHR